MYTLHDINKSTLEELVVHLSKIMDIDIAIFDEKSNLLACTQVYLENKGKIVHSNSIEEVLLQKNVIVNKPGHMNSCIGCRFNNNCPSKIEILSCITLDNRSLGVVSFTSFTKEGHEKISNNITSYLKLLEQTSNLISMFALNKAYNNKCMALEETINQIIQASHENIIIVNDRGNISYCNPAIQKMFSFCNLYTKSIYQIFPNDISTQIMEGKKINKKCKISNNYFSNIHSWPIKTSNKIVGHIIKITNNHKIKNVQPHKSFLDNIITNDEKIVHLKKKIEKISNSTSSIVISGETGTGKELFAKAIHYTGNRSNGPFVPINCANIPDNLFESELFGYEEGAFTGAKKGGKPGRFQLANEGTLFLDEIGELPIYQQSKLLRVLQDHVIVPVGSTQTIPIDVRIIAATNKNLEKMIEKGTFRNDLYYRLNVIPINIPPLRERKNDIEPLAYYFLKKYCLKLNKNIVKISDSAINKLYDYNWPGNIRELENAIEYAVNMEDRNYISLENLPERLINCENVSINQKINNIELDMIKTRLDKNGWDLKGKEKTAKELDISLRTLYRRIKKLEN